MKSEITKTQEEKTQTNSQRSGQHKQTPPATRPSVVALAKPPLRKQSVEKQSTGQRGVYGKGGSDLKQSQAGPGRSVDRQNQKSVDNTKARNGKPALQPTKGPSVGSQLIKKREDTDNNMARSIDSNSAMKESNHVSASQQSLTAPKAPMDKRMVHSSQDLSGKVPPRNQLSVNAVNIEARAKDSAGFSISSKKNLGNSSANFARNGTPRQPNSRPVSAQSRGVANPSGVSTKPKLVAPSKGEVEYKHKYERMKQSNKLLQENMDQLLKKHQKLLDFCQNLQRENVRQKQAIEKLQEERQTSRGVRAAPTSQKDIKKTAFKGSFRKI